VASATGEGAKVMAKGQITLPKDIRERLTVGAGDHVVMMDPALSAMRVLQERMDGQVEQAGFTDEDDVADCISQMRREERRG
jgi:AbrB family looped-hinge helix DNA binding protein